MISALGPTIPERAIKALFPDFPNASDASENAPGILPNENHREIGVQRRLFAQSGTPTFETTLQDQANSCQSGGVGPNSPELALGEETFGRTKALAAVPWTPTKEPEPFPATHHAGTPISLVKQKTPGGLSLDDKRQLHSFAVQNGLGPTRMLMGRKTAAKRADLDPRAREVFALAVAYAGKRSVSLPEAFAAIAAAAPKPSET
jgi:hypothetical protein